jgi:hypothetical protein
LKIKGLLISPKPELRDKTQGCAKQHCAMAQLPLKSLDPIEKFHWFKKHFEGEE